MKTPHSLFLIATAIAGPWMLPDGMAQSVDALSIERRSGYQAPAERSPFWPIGWAPSDLTVVAPVQTQELDLEFFAPERFNLSSISTSGNLPLALINGRAYSVGDPVPINNTYNAEVTAIRDGKVELRFRGKTITVPLKAQQRSRQ